MKVVEAKYLVWRHFYLRDFDSLDTRKTSIFDDCLKPTISIHIVEMEE